MLKIDGSVLRNDDIACENAPIIHLSKFYYRIWLPSP